MKQITEIIPDDIPEWFEEAMEEGQLFRTAIEKVKNLEHDKEVLTLALGAAGERIDFLLNLIPPKRTKIAKNAFDHYPFKKSSPREGT